MGREGMLKMQVEEFGPSDRGRGGMDFLVGA